MAKKQETKKEVVTEEVTQVVEKPKRKEPSYRKAEDGWEIKDRTYFLKNNQKPLSYKIKTANIYWFDENNGFEREL